MIGKTWMNKETEEVYRFMAKTQIDDVVKIATDKEWFEVSYYDLSVFMQKFKEVPDTSVTIIEPSKQQKQQLMSKSLGEDVITKLRDVLLDNINKVKTDPAYIPQAKTISDNVNSLVALAKAEIDLRTKG